MKKRILITMPSMHIGGAERSLLGLLEAIDSARYEVDLFLYRQEGEFLPFLPDTVRLLPAKRAYRAIDSPIQELFKSGQILLGCARLLAKCLCRMRAAGIWKHLQYIYRLLEPLLPVIATEQYDLAIGFLGVHNLLLRKTRAKVKSGWIHTDYSTFDPDEKLDCAVYSQLDYIVNVSEECTRTFVQRYPQFVDKCVTIENILAPSSVRAQAQLQDVWNELHPEGKGTALLSAGRFTYAKNFENVPWICRLLVEEGLDLRWYLVGYGGMEEIIRRQISEAGMEDRVILLGKKENPYPYLRACDLYVQPSRYEGKAVAVREAQILGKPVAITAFATALSQLEDGVDGAVVPMDNEGCARELAKLLRDTGRMEQLSKNCRRKNYGNEAEVEKIYRLMEDG